MALSSNKLVDKYQYNDSQTKTDGFAQIITAKHIVLRQMFTLKKISISNPKAASKYHGINNQMNILKSLGDQPFLFKCHKMLKTSNNLYLVYDFMGKYPTLAQLIENNSINGQSKKKYIALRILKYLKQLKKYNIVFLDLNPQIIQVNQKYQVKFANLQNAIFLNKNITSLSFLNLKISQNLSPQVKDFIETCSVPYEKEIQFSLFQQKLNKADLFSFGKILQKLFSQQFQFVQIQSQKNITNSQCFQQSIKKIVQRLLSKEPNQRPNYEQIQSLLSDNKIQTKEQIQNLNPQIKISRLDRNNTLTVSAVNNQLKKSRSAMKTSRMNPLKTTKLLSIPTGEDSFDNKSVRSSGEYTDSTSYGKIKQRKSSFNNLIESQVSNDESYRAFVLKVLTRRNLCKLLLSLSKFIFQMTLIDLNQRAMLSFLLLKKGVLLACSLARFVSTGKGDGEQLVVKQSIRRQFAKTNDFFLLSVLVDKQMDNAKIIYQTTIAKFRSQFSDLKNIKQYNFDYECISENINEKVMKQLIKKSIIQLLKKLQTPVKQAQPHKKALRNLLNPSDESKYLWTSVRSRKDSDFDETNSVRSAKTIRTTVQPNSYASQITLQNFHSDKILRNISFDNLILIYLMGLILDFQTYEKMFVKLIEDSNIRFQERSLLKQLRKMEARQVAFKLVKMVK